jgi:DNA polymerase III epsilon subunit-like protein
MPSEEIVFIDTETTGLGGLPHDKIVEIAIVNYNGDILFHSLINPERSIGFTTYIHGITDEMVQEAPTFEECWEDIKGILKGKHIIIFNAAFDSRFFPDQLSCANQISCAMAGFQRVYRAGGGNSRKYNLRFATDHIGYSWEGEHHRALADTLAARAVWLWIEKRVGEGVLSFEAGNLETIDSFDFRINSSLSLEYKPYPILQNNQFVVEPRDTILLNADPNNWLPLEPIEIDDQNNDQVSKSLLIGKTCGDIIYDFHCTGLLLTVQIANIIKSESNSL